METQFNLFEGERLRNHGMDAAQTSHKDPLQEARGVAASLGKEQRYVTADDVRERLEDWGCSVELGNAWGSLFRGRCWQPTPRRVKSRYAPNHAREIKVWEYVERAPCTAV